MTRRLPLLFTTLLASVLLAGCTSSTPKPATPTSPATPAVVSAPSGMDAATTTTCRLAAQVGNQSEPVQQRDLQPVIDAGAEARDFDVHYAATMLAARRQVWQQARGRADEPARAVELATALIDLQTACVKAHAS